jgi:hypothetical protein
MDRSEVLRVVYPDIESTGLLKTAWNKIQANTDKELGEVMFLIFIYLNKRAIEIDQTPADEPGRKKALLALADEMKETFTRQILHETQASMNSAIITNLLKTGFESLMFMLPQVGGQELDEFVNEVFVHDKGYPRSINFVQSYMPFSKRTLESVVTEFLEGFVNTNIFTGAQDEKTRREQLTQGWTGKDKKAKYEAWGRIVGHIAQKLHLGWEKAPVKKFLEQNEMKFVNALREVIPVTEAKVFMTKDFNIVAEKLYLLD